MKRIVELEDGSICEVLHMFDFAGAETKARTNAVAIVVQLPDGEVIPGEVDNYQGIHAVH